MMLTGSVISGIYQGDDVEIVRTVGNLPDGATITDGWLMVKRDTRDADEDAIIRKHITAAAQAGVGQILHDGADGDGEIVFQLTKDETRQLTARAYAFGIRLRLSSGDEQTREQGVIQAAAAVVAAAPE